MTALLYNKVAEEAGQDVLIYSAPPLISLCWDLHILSNSFTFVKEEAFQTLPERLKDCLKMTLLS
jgi:hypothetical protein